MNAAVLAPAAAAGSPFDPDAGASWLRWRARKLAARPRGIGDLVVEVRDPRRLTPFERAAIVERCRRANMAIYAARADPGDDGTDIPRRMGAQLGLATLDVPALAEGDGISRIACDRAKARAGFIPYTSRRMRWHTDGCSSPAAAPVRSLVLHCVRPAASGGETALLDPELAWLLLRETDPELVRALMHADTLAIPAGRHADGRIRPAACGPVFSIDPRTGDLAMRFTARRRWVRWRHDATTAEAAARLLAAMDHDRSSVLRLRLEPGLGLVCNNVLHARAAFDDSAGPPRLLLRARFRERIAGTAGAWADLAG